MPDKEKDTRKILIEMTYGENGATDIQGIQIKIRNTSIVDLILGWSALTEKVIQATNKPSEDKSLTTFLANTIGAYFEQAHKNVEGEEDGDADEDVETAEEDPGVMTEEQ